MIRLQRSNCKLKIAEPGPSDSRPPVPGPQSPVRSAFTLFELILAIALSATLLVLIGTAINLYLVRVEAGRTQVEEAQLARSILATIAADVRTTTLYQTQDLSGVTRLAAEEDITDEFGQSGPFTQSALGSSTGSGQTSTSGVDTTPTLQPGLNGTQIELILDTNRMPGLNELFPPLPQQQATVTPIGSVAAPRPSAAKLVRYFVRQGNPVDPSDAAATTLSPEAQASLGGLVRQTIDQAVRAMAEETGNTVLLEGGQTVLAPEVLQIQFRYFDGTEAWDEWDMAERGALPLAIEVRIWLANPDAPVEQVTAGYAGISSMLDNAHMYLQTIELPLAGAGSSGSAAAGTDSSTSSDTGDTTGTGGTGGTGNTIGTGGGP